MNSSSPQRILLEFRHATLVGASTLATLLPLLANAASASAQLPAQPRRWIAVPLHPTQTSAARSAVLGLDSAQAVGSAQISGRDHAGLWGKTASSFVDLHPAGAFDSIAFDVEEGVQVGYTTFGGGSIQRAGLWHGQAASWTELHPSGADLSAAVGIGGGQQVGWVTIGGNPNPLASLWSGSSSSWLGLHPAGHLTSIARRTDGVQQVGYVFVNGTTHAALWQGSAASWVDLQPAGALWSEANDVDGGQQVGYVRLSTGNVDHASLWTGSAATWTDLHPAGTLESRLVAVREAFQVGFTDSGGFARRAALWQGSASTVVDLHAILPARYGRSQASDVHLAPHFIVVGGIAFDQNLGRNEAVLWIAPR